MASKRGQGQSWELRLGAVQIVIWLGLAVGAVVGAYFVGFFQGNYVGFETGRGASGVEVAKLAVTEPLPESAVEQGESAIYDKLQATAPIVGTTARDAAAVKKEGATDSEGRLVSKIAQDIKLADEEKRLAEDEKKLAGLVADSSGSAKKPLNELAEPLPIENELFARDDLQKDVQGDSSDMADGAGAGSEPDLFDPDASVAAPPNVRMLGAGRDAGAVDGGRGNASASGKASDSISADLDSAAPVSEKQKTLGAILDERVDSARAVAIPDSAVEEESVQAPLPVVKSEPTKEPARTAPQVEPVEAKQIAPTPAPTRKATAVPEKKPTTAPDKKPTTAVVVKKVVPSGFFVQVAAPTKRSDAESVARKLKSSGFPVVVEEANVNGDSYYRVLVGPEDKRIQADRLIQQLQSERYLSSVPFVRKVK
jgi:cell division septation protein DedD